MDTTLEDVDKTVTKESFITRYVNVISDFYDIPKIFIQASGYHLVSALLGRFFYCPSIPGPARPNLWFILSSVPGRMRRSTLQDIDSRIYKGVLSKFWEETKPPKLFPEYTGRVDELVSDTIIEEGSAEGIMDHLSDIYKKLDCFDIEGSEFGAIFQKMSGNSYEAGVPSLLSKLYSGEGGTMLLSKRSGLKKRYLPPRLFVTMLVGLQEPEYYITPIMIRQGLMRRVVLINVDKATSYKPLIDDRRFAAAPAINRFIEELTTKMIEFDKIHTTVCASGDEHILCNLHPTVQDKINEFSRKLDEAVDKEPTNLNIVKQTFGLHLSNLTIIEGILEGTFDSGTRTLSITESHLDPAYKFLIEATSNYESIIPSLGRKKESIVSYEAPLEMLYEIIATAGPSGISQSELYSKTKMTEEVLKPLLEALVLAGRIHSELGPSSGGRPPVIWKAIRPAKTGLLFPKTSGEAEKEVKEVGED